jgi:hypothetical protein
VSLVAGLVVVRSIPFVDHSRRVRAGMLVVPFDRWGDRVRGLAGHTVWWGGGMPCDAQGGALSRVVAREDARDLGDGVVVSHLMCNRPPDREFHDHHELVSAYVALISGYAMVLDPAATARGSRGAIPVEDRDTPFRYMDTASARAGVVGLNAKLHGSRIGIVGLGGTGSYVLDLVAKTPVGAIHLYDGDLFEQHSAFRFPGAASREDIDAGRAKVDHFAAVYSNMHTRIFPHRTRIDRHNLGLPDPVDFVFLCIDEGGAKQPIVERLERDGKSYIDCGIGVVFDRHGLMGALRTTTSTPAMRDHVRDKERIPFVGGGGEPDAYSSNIQIADLNALNAALAVLRWKRLCGFYADGGGEHHSVFVVDSNQIINADRAEPAVVGRSCERS